MKGVPRRRLLIEMCPRGGFIVDVGADHGHVAHAVGAVALERQPQRTGRTDVPWVIGDGLSCFERVDTAIIAGMGAHTIAGILARGPAPKQALVHAPDDPPTLRLLLARSGWRILEERLAPEAKRFAEVLLIERGEELATGIELELGPRLLAGDDPLLRPHLEQLLGWYSGIADATAGQAQDKHRWASERRDFIAHQLQVRGWTH